MTKNTTSIGARAEEAAARFLVSRGYDVLARNWRTRFCEIDLVVFDGSTVVFCEVKYRRNRDFGGGEAAIDHHKAARLVNAAQLWLQSFSLFGDYLWQIDVIVVEGPPARAKIFHYPNAVTLDFR